MTNRHPANPNPPGSSRPELHLPAPKVPAEIPMMEQEAAAVYEGLILLQAFLAKGGDRRRRRSIFSERHAVNVQDRICETFPRLKAYYRAGSVTGTMPSRG